RCEGIGGFVHCWRSIHHQGSRKNGPFLSQHEQSFVPFLFCRTSGKDFRQRLTRPAGKRRQHAQGRQPQQRPSGQGHSRGRLTQEDRRQTCNRQERRSQYEQIRQPHCQECKHFVHGRPPSLLRLLPGDFSLASAINSSS